MKRLTNGQTMQHVMSNKAIKTEYVTKSGEVKNRYRYPAGTKVVKTIAHEKQKK